MFIKFYHGFDTTQVCSRKRTQYSRWSFYAIFFSSVFSLSKRPYCLIRTTVCWKEIIALDSLFYTKITVQTTNLLLNLHGRPWIWSSVDQSKQCLLSNFNIGGEFYKNIKTATLKIVNYFWYFVSYIIFAHPKITVLLQSFRDKFHGI